MMPERTEIGQGSRRIFKKVFGSSYNTKSACSFSNALTGSEHRPGCTLEVCSMVLRVAVSHLKRLAVSNRAIGPPSAWPVAMRSKACKYCFSCATSAFSSRHSSFFSSSWQRVCRKLSLLGLRSGVDNWIFP